jgi:hypothetical protein
MRVTYPFSEDVLKTEFRGNLAQTYSKTQKSDVIGNICPHCGAYQGNYFVWDDCIIGHAYDLKNYIVSYLDVKVNCFICQKNFDKSSIKEDWELLSFYEDYLNIQNLTSKNKEKAYEAIIENVDPYWLCDSCLGIESEKRRKIQEEDRIRQIRERPLISCRLCKKNNRENPETIFVYHHVSYFPEEKITVCSSCHMKIHHSNSYPNFKPRDEKVSEEQKKKRERRKNIQLIKEGKLSIDEYCYMCGEKFEKDKAFTFVNGTKVHTDCLWQNV